jgi:low temperature requirement protein LtrA
MWGGTTLFLMGTLMFDRVVRGRYQRSHLHGLVSIFFILYFYENLSSLSFYGIVTGILVCVAALEAYSPPRGSAETEQSAAIDTET